MRQLMFESQDDYAWRDAPDPEISAPCQALVRPLLVACCDLDVGVSQGRLPMPPGHAIGHEGVAEVVAIGDDVKSVQVGDRVVVPWHFVVLVNPVLALSFTPVAHAEPRPPDPDDKQFVTTESRTVKCVIAPGTVLCTGSVANAPTRCGETPDCDPDGLGNRDHTVWVDAEGEGLKWNDSNFQSYGYTELVLTYGQVFRLKGWTVEPSSEGTRFTNDGTGRGMFVSRQGVTSLVTRADPEDGDVCAAATEGALMAALKSSPDFYSRLAPPIGFSSIQCSPPFAIGWTAVSSIMTLQPAGVLFRRDGSRWTVLDIGTAMRCAQYGVTAANALEGCVV